MVKQQNTSRFRTNFSRHKVLNVPTGATDAVQISTNVTTPSKYLTFSTKVLTAPMMEELDVKTLCMVATYYLLHVFVQIATTIEEGSTNSTGKR